MKADSISKVIAQKEKELKDLQAALAATAVAANPDSVKAQQENTSNKSEVAMDTITNSNASKEGTNPAIVGAAAATTVAATGSNAAVTPSGNKTGAAAVVAAPALLDMEFNMNKDSVTSKKADTVKATTAKPDTLVPAIPPVVETVTKKT